MIRDGKRRSLTAEVAKIRVTSAAAGEATPQLQGAVLRDLDPGSGRKGGGVLVASVERGSPAWRVGLRDGDVIVAVNRAEVGSVVEGSWALAGPGRRSRSTCAGTNTMLYMVVQPVRRGDPTRCVFALVAACPIICVPRPLQLNRARVALISRASTRESGTQQNELQNGSGSCGGGRDRKSGGAGADAAGIGRHRGGSRGRAGEGAGTGARTGSWSAASSASPPITRAPTTTSSLRAPIASIRWAEGYGVSLGPSTMRTYQLRGDLLPSRNWSFGPLLQRRDGRQGVDDPRVDNLSDIDPAWEAGAHFGYRLGIDPNNPVTTLGINIQAAADISDESNGWLVQPGLDYITRFSPQWLFNARLFSTYADQNYMQEYFGIGASNVRDSGLRFYNADEGFKDVGVRVAADYQFSERWSAGGGVQYIRLIGDAEDSPVTKRGSEDQFFGGVSLSYRF